MHSHLRSRVRGEPRDGAERDRGGDEDDARVRGGLEQWQGEAGHADGAAEVDLYLFDAARRGTARRERVAAHHARVVYEQVEATEL